MQQLFNPELNIDPKTLADVPSFIKHRYSYQSKVHSFKQKNNINQQNFSQVTLSDPVQKTNMIKRMEQWIKGTPKVIKLSQKKNETIFKVSFPEKNLLQELSHLTDSIKLQKIIETVQILFNIVEKYGYFYPQKEMLRISKGGDPVVWMHKNFCSLERELPISLSFISSLIFVQKIKSIFAQILAFPKKIENKIQLLEFLEQQKKKYANWVGKSTFPFPLSSKKLVDYGSLQRRTVHRIPSNRSISPINIKSNIKQQNSLSKIKIRQTPSYKSLAIPHKQKENKIVTDVLKIKVIAKTTNPQFVDLDSGSKTGRSSIFDKSTSNRSDLSQKMKTSQFCGKQNHKTFIPHQKIHNVKLFKDTCNNECISNFQFLQAQPKKENVNKKYRKSSAQVSFGHWKKDSVKIAEKTFPNSTFSTRVTLGSIRGESQNCESEQRYLKNEVIPHFNEVNKQKQIKQKLIAQKNINKESGIKITEQNSFQNEVQNLFASKQIGGIQTKKKSVRESELASEFEKLFQDSICSELKQSYSKDFMLILN